MSLPLRREELLFWLRMKDFSRTVNCALKKSFPTERWYRSLSVSCSKQSWEVTGRREGHGPERLRERSELPDGLGEDGSSLSLSFLFECMYSGVGYVFCFTGGKRRRRIRFGSFKPQLTFHHWLSSPLHFSLPFYSLQQPLDEQQNSFNRRREEFLSHLYWLFDCNFFSSFQISLVTKSSFQTFSLNLVSSLFYYYRKPRVVSRRTLRAPSATHNIIWYDHNILNLIIYPSNIQGK